MVVYQRDAQIEAGYIDGMDKISILANAPANCNNGYSSSLGATNPTCNNGTWSGACNARCEWLSNITGKWVDAIVNTGCADCKTEDKCRSKGCNSGGGLYRWDLQGINCNI